LFQFFRSEFIFVVLIACRSTMLTACVFVTRDTVRHPRRFVFGKFVRKPSYSWSEAFVNRGLTVFGKIALIYKQQKCTRFSGRHCSLTSINLFRTSSIHGVNIQHFDFIVWMQNYNVCGRINWWTVCGHHELAPEHYVNTVVWWICL